MLRNGSLLARTSITLALVSNIAWVSSLHAQVERRADPFTDRTGPLAEVCAIMALEIADEGTSMGRCELLPSPLSGFRLLEATAVCVSKHYVLVDARSETLRTVVELEVLDDVCRGGRGATFALSGVRQISIGRRTVVMLESELTTFDTDISTRTDVHMVFAEHLHKYVTFCIADDSSLRDLSCGARIEVRHVGVVLNEEERPEGNTTFDRAHPEQRWDWRVAFAITSTGRVFVQPRVGVWPADESAGSPSMFSLW